MRQLSKMHKFTRLKAKVLILMITRLRTGDRGTLRNRETLRGSDAFYTDAYYAKSFSK